MENQLEQLEGCIKRLVLHFNSHLAEKDKLNRQVTMLKEQLQNQIITAQQERSQLSKQYEQEKLHLQDAMQRQIDDLIADRNRYKGVLETSTAELKQLLQRLPVSQEEYNG